MRSIFLVLVATLLASVSVDARLRRGLAWGTDNRWATTIAKGTIEWYWHWEQGAVSEMPSRVEYVPNFWGPSKWGLWNQRKKEISKMNSQRILAFNEPDVKGQADMDPKYAATLFMQELEPYRKKGIKVSSPQIVWDVDWMDKFLKALRAKGGDVDFMAIHWYGGYKEINNLKTWVKKINKRYNKSVWLTEYGVTASSHPSQAQIKNFHVQATEWLQSQSYVKRAAWLGCFAVSSPPDSFAAARNAFFNSGGSLRSWAKWYVWTGNNKRDELPSTVERSHRTPGALRHNNARAHRAVMEAREEAEEALRTREAEEALLAEDDDDDDVVDNYQGEAVSCDEWCQKRASAVAAALDEDDELSADGLGDATQWTD